MYLSEGGCSTSWMLWYGCFIKVWSTRQGPLRLGWLKGLRVELLVVRFCDQNRNNIHNLNQYARLEVHDQTIREPKQKNDSKTETRRN